VQKKGHQFGVTGGKDGVLRRCGKKLLTPGCLVHEGFIRGTESQKREELKQWCWCARDQSKSEWRGRGFK